ncbi:FecCD family ABC transporter permease [Swaminathania salitolerans]|uniref:Iron(III) ABC transporter permease n=1 Tax=Swaminathania salitolerans TaxID=182838 RepID=A0A511BQ06_9PROT|nr:iron ABC transporter permease [Swaminathania salitolerans]GBQ11306.1 Fe3+-siderophore ABC transporter permease [Swaminathania salitolerans LMG 21291]GEL02421.1 iron(III) ABC transporter permease [Swaminathania salitolerans]
MTARVCFATAGVALLLAALVALCSGRYAIGPLALFASLGHDGDITTRAVLLQARLPRLVASVGIGAALSVSGAAFQAVFRNPLVSPDLLGVLSGSAFGAAAAILCHATPVTIQLATFAGGCCAVGCGFCIARLVGSEGILPLLLGGLISAALFTALLSLLKYLADPFDTLPAIIYWLLGSLAQTRWPELAVIMPILCLVMGALWIGGRLLDVLGLSDDEAHSLGLPIGAMRWGVLLLATALGALTVSLAGMIGWIGLLVPHIARLLVGPDHRLLLPFSAMLGAVCLTLADTAARTLSPSEMPLGMMTELFGALGFIFVLRRLRREGSL